MKQAIADVRAFYEACGEPTTDVLSFPSDARMAVKEVVFDEEYGEYKKALRNRDSKEFADAIGDMIYVLIGICLECGIALDRVWAEIQRSNLAKKDPVTGKVKRHPNGKVAKPDNWTPPDIAKALTGDLFGGA